MGKTNYTKQIVDDYCVLDTETTGLSAYYDEVIEIGILKIRNNKVVDQYSQLIQPENEIDPFITHLTGISNEMVAGMPSILDVKERVLSFIGNDIILGHNTSFDIRFLNKGFQLQIPNPYMDTIQFARKIYPELKHHRLSDLTEYLNLSRNEHRSISDCLATKELYDAIKKNMADNNLKIENLWSSGKSPKRKSGQQIDIQASDKQRNKGIDIKAIIPEATEIDEDNYFFGKHIVFTGKLEKMTRKEAMQIVVNLGGILDGSVCKQTNLLILGDNDYNAILKGEKSSKHKKAEQLKLKGQDIEIIDEFTFYDILNE